MLLIFVSKLTNRLGYTLNLTFRVLLQCDFSITTDPQVFAQHNGAKLCYCSDAMANAVHIKPSPLLFAHSLEEQTLHPFVYEGLPALFPVYGRDLSLPFDPFSAIFYIISRYEEYLPFHKDAHGRFTAAESIAYQQGFLQTAIVDRWAMLVRDTLLQQYPTLNFTKRQFKVVETVDIDAAYCYKYKGVIRSLMGMLRDGLQRHNKAALRQRIRVLCNKEADPFDTFDYIINFKKQHKEIRLLFFTLLSDYGQYDKPTSYHNSHFRQLLQHLGDYAKIGIHPSYNAINNPHLIDIEMHRLEGILHRKIVRSRFHFLRLQLPHSYRDLMHADIHHDYSMGYAEVVGFRAGTTTAHPFYDLERDCESDIKVHPFVAMDTTLQKYMHLSPEQAIKQYKTLIDEIHSVGGSFNTIWHNQNLCEQFGWQGWREVYEKTLAYACSLVPQHNTTK